MKKIIIFFICCFLFSCSSTQKMKRIEHNTFYQKESKEARKDRKENKLNYKYSKPPKR